MAIGRVLMDFSGVGKREKSCEIKIDGSTYRIIVGVNPRSGNTICSIYRNREELIKNAVAVDRELILSEHSSIYENDIIPVDFYFVNTKETAKLGNVVDYRDLGSSTFLYSTWEG